MAQFFGLSDRPATLGSIMPGKRPYPRAKQEQTDARKILRLGRNRVKRYWNSAALLFEARRLFQNARLQ